MAGRVLAIDPGTKRIGIALSDPNGTIAHPLAVLSVGKETVSEIVELVAEHEVGELVIGLPLQLDGAEGQAAAEARAFAEKVRTQISVPVILFDERLTTAAARGGMARSGVSERRGRGDLDKYAAAILLQSYLDARSPHSPHTS